MTVDDIRVMLRDLKNERYYRKSVFKIITVQEVRPFLLELFCKACEKKNQTNRKTFDDFMLETR